MVTIRIQPIEKWTKLKLLSSIWPRDHTWKIRQKVFFSSWPREMGLRTYEGLDFSKNRNLICQDKNNIIFSFKDSYFFSRSESMFTMFSEFIKLPKLMKLRNDEIARINSNSQNHVNSKWFTNFKPSFRLAVKYWNPFLIPLIIPKYLVIEECDKLPHNSSHFSIV